MNPVAAQAIKVLYEATGKLKLTRSKHEEIQSAFSILMKELSSQVKEVKKK